MDQRFEGRTAFVTGAGSGIGRAVAQRLAAEATAKGIAGTGARAVAITCDVAFYDQVGAAVDGAVAALGPLDLACNIAGIGWFAHSHEEDPDRFARAIAVNLTGTYNVCRAVLPAMLDRAKGVIVNTASNAGLMGQPFSAAYCASKGGVVNLTRALGIEYRARGVRVNAIAPGGMNTPMIQAFGFPEGATAQDFASITSPLGYAEPEEQAVLIAFIASDEGRYMVGQIVSMDGGITCG